MDSLRNPSATVSASSRSSSATSTRTTQLLNLVIDRARIVGRAYGRHKDDSNVDESDRLRASANMIDEQFGTTTYHRHRSRGRRVLGTTVAVAALLAGAVAGSQRAFVARMNDMAHALGMQHTTYTDPSGFDENTRSTADDQLILAQRAMRLPEFASLVALRTAELPVAGTVHNTDTLLGHDGFVGIKTGSDDAAGGCFMFRVQRRGGDLTGVVLGRRGHDLIAAGLNAARDLA